jgi:hypothetical protein
LIKKKAPFFTGLSDIYFRFFAKQAPSGYPEIKVKEESVV